MSIESPSKKPNRFIAGDWGTTNLRLYLCEFDASKSRILETRFGQGISQIDGDFEDNFFNLAQDWIDANGKIPVLLSGMIGSNIGWKEVPYFNCPVSAQALAKDRTMFTARDISFSILSGLKTTNPLNSPDVMRGEELQLLGWMKSHNTDSGRRLFALPGTHNKWAMADGDHITNFLTAFTGELFALLSSHSILIKEHNSSTFNDVVFMQAVNAVKNMGEAQLVHALFSTRAKQVLGDISNEDGLSYLSGLIIGADVKGALTLFDDFDDITIIGEQTLSERYATVIEHFGATATRCDPASIAISGFSAIYEYILLDA